MAEWDDELRRLISAKTAAQPPLQALDAIDRAERALFLSRYAEASRPVVIRNVLADSEARFWTLDSLARCGGKEMVKVRHGDYIGAAFSQSRAEFLEPLSAYIERLRAPATGEGPPPYAGNNPLVGSLAAMIRPPSFFRPADYEMPGLWLGPAGTVTPLHQDLVDNFLIQIIGRKRIVLLAPHEEPHLYTWEASNKLRGSKVNPESPDLDLYPAFRHASPFTCTLHAGETLFLPAGWFHQVTALDLSLSINVFLKRVPAAVLESMRRKPALSSARE